MNKYDNNQLEIEEVSHKKIYYSIIESLLYVSGDPLGVNTIASIIECSVDYTEKIDERINEDI